MKSIKSFLCFKLVLINRIEELVLGGVPKDGEEGRRPPVVLLGPVCTIEPVD